MINLCLEIEACNYSDRRALEIQGDHKTIWLSKQSTKYRTQPILFNQNGRNDSEVGVQNRKIMVLMPSE